ncbi:BQ2448_3918 [Microbotryum intermedium]|uniref:BQ2448_3918 protein n=1 Tax=Microbotryum intermedium TaxID=269621 RepID=A0A238FJQ2_9BASI|nr:BQ2448_3918 [Microbotryum intermedium]
MSHRRLSEQDVLECADAFKIARLRFLRPPPAMITVPESTSPQTPCLVPIDLMIGITDDYGVHLDMFESLELRLRVVDCGDHLSTPIEHVELWVDGNDKGHYVLNTSRGNYHKVTASIKIGRSLNKLPKAVRFEVSVAGTKAPPERLSEYSQRILEIIGEEGQAVLEAWDGQRYIFMSSLSGNVELKKGGSLPADSGKVQTNLRRIYTHPAPSPFSWEERSKRSISIVERQSTGQRLWDCAIGMSGFLSHRPDALFPSHPLQKVADRFPSSSPNEQAADPSPATKRSKRSAPRLVLLELGAGCALASQFATVLLDKKKLDGSFSLMMTAAQTHVIATDVEDTVATTLRENLAYNHLSDHVDSKVLRWGPLDSSSIDALIGPSDDGIGLTLLGTDVLYNPESHQALLDTLTSFLSQQTAAGGHRRALIAYKARTQGDDHFFQLARDNAGMQVTLVWRWGEISVWSLHATSWQSSSEAERHP